MPRPVDLVVFGYRPGALHAAARLGLDVLLVDDKPATPIARRRIVDAHVAALEGPPDALAAEVHDVLDGASPRGVLAAGERGVLAAASLRDRFDLPGVDAATAFRARDKPCMKAAARAAGVACTDWVELDAGSDAAGLARALGYPVVLKKRAGSGTAGLVVAHTEADLRDALEAIPAAERTAWMAERFVRGAEMSIESFIRDGRIVFVNPTEYFVIAYANIAPAALDEEERRAVLALNEAAIGALGIGSGMTHLELYRTADGPLFGEVAVRPPGGRIMRLLRRAYDLDPWEIVIRLEMGLDLPPLPERARRVAGVWMLHPGPGTVASVRGLAAARRIRGVRKLVCRVRAGVEVGPRLNTGSDVGWIEVSGRNRDETAARLQAAHDAVAITLR